MKTATYPYFPNTAATHAYNYIDELGDIEPEEFESVHQRYTNLIINMSDSTSVEFKTKLAGLLGKVRMSYLEGEYEKAEAWLWEVFETAGC